MDDPFFMPAGHGTTTNTTTSKSKKRLIKKSSRNGDTSSRKRHNNNERKNDDEEYGNAFDDDELMKCNDDDDDDNDDDDGDIETAAEKRVRLAHSYLDGLRDDDDVDDVAGFLDVSIDEKQGKLRREIANEYCGVSERIDAAGGVRRYFRGHQGVVTCVALTPDDRFAFTGGKDGSIVKWDIANGKRLATCLGGRSDIEGHTGHTGHILAIDVSADGTLVASGSSDKLLVVWSTDALEHVHTFSGHQGPVTGVAFRRRGGQLFSCSGDRTVKVWDTTQMMYVETLFGHQDGVVSIDALGRERAVTVGGRDSSVRVWKLSEESQLEFRGPKSSVDCIALSNEETFAAGYDDGTLALFGLLKKKPTAIIESAHGQDGWIQSIATSRFTDLVISGSSDGAVRLWRIADGGRRLAKVGSIPVEGCINDIAIANSGNFAVAAVGREFRLGRWTVLRNAKDCFCVIPLPRSTNNNGNGEDENDDSLAAMDIVSKKNGATESLPNKIYTNVSQRRRQQQKQGFDSDNEDIDSDSSDE